MKREKPMPWQVFIGSMLTMLSIAIAFLFNYIILGAPYYTSTLRPPFGREPLLLAATLVAIVLLGSGLVLVYTGLRKMETK